MVDDFTKRKIVEFLKPYYPDTDYETIFNGIDKYFNRGTYDYALKDGEVVAVVLWELLKNGTVAHIKDLIIKKEYRNMGIWKDFVVRAVKQNPHIVKVSFNRSRRNDGRTRTYNIEKFTWRI